MGRKLNTAIVLLMLALLPLRALAAVALDDCAMSHEATGGPAHSHDNSTGGHEDCASASFVASAPLPILPVPLASDRVVRRERFAAGFILDPLDPPPLAL